MGAIILCVSIDTRERKFSIYIFNLTVSAEVGDT